MFKIDLHTHSVGSPDGGISRADYQRALYNGVLDAVAVTDHNHIKFAALLRKEFGERIIVGEEIMSTAGEIVGLYLDEVVKPGQTPLETVKQIKDQGGIVYIPHPFETVRKGLPVQVLEELSDYIDIVEICNGRAVFQNRSAQAAVWARMHQKIGAASSDAHGFHGLGKTYTLLSEAPTRDTILSLVASGSVTIGRPGMRALLYPKYNRARKKLWKR